MASVKYGSVCSGIEAATVAWEPLGWRAEFYSEIDAFPSALLAHYYPGVSNLGDMNNFREWPDAIVDVLVGGTPCQSFSVAGLRQGLRDPRGNLALVYLALADRIRPSWIVWENVPGILSSNAGRDFGAFIGGLGQLGYGYAWRVLDAQYFGLAQRRARVFVVGHLGDWRRAAAVLFERESLRGDPPPRRESKKGITGALRAGSGGGCQPGIDEAAAGQLIAYGGNNTAGPIEVSAYLNAHGGPVGRLDFESETFIVQGPIAFAENSRAELRLEGGDGSRTGSLSAGGGKPGQGMPVIAFHGSQDPDVSGDITHPVGRNGCLETCAALESGVRRLTPRECERLQGFKDDYTLIGYRGKPASDGPRYKAIGNSMAVPVMRWIGERIAMVDVIKIEE